MCRNTFVLLTGSLLAAACGDDSSGSGDDGSGTGAAVADSGTGDGNTDDAGPSMTSAGSGGIECVEQQGSGPCLDETVLPLPSIDVAFGDFDGDGDVDILARSEETGPGGADEVVLLANDGGRFDEGTALPFADTPSADDIPLSLSRPRAMGTPTTAVHTAFLQGIYGSFGDVRVDAWWIRAGSVERFYDPTDSPPAGPWFGDFDGDGGFDLIFAPDASSLSQLELHSCMPDACQGSNVTPASGTPDGPWTVLGMDTTGDGLDELVVVRSVGAGAEAVILENDGSSFSQSTTVDLGNDIAPASAQLMDVDADGALDLVLTSAGQPSTNEYGSVLHAFVQDGSGSLTSDIEFDAGERITGFTFGDFNDDAVPDMVLRLTDRTSLNVGLGPGFDAGATYTLTASETGIVGQSIPTWPTTVVDLDGDDVLDAITVTSQGGQAYAANVLLSR